MAPRFWVGGTGTWDNSDTTHWASSSNGAGGVAVPASGDTVTFDGNSGGGTVTVAATINGTNTISSLTMGAFTGTLDFSANDPNITMSTFSGSGTGTRTLNMGDGTWTITSTGNNTIWDMATTTNLTFNANGSTIAFAAAGSANRTINPGGLTYNIMSFSDSGGGFSSFLWSSNSNATIATLNITAPVKMAFGQGRTITITNSFNWAGSSSNPILLLVRDDVNGAGTTISSANNGTIDYGVLRGLTFSGGGTFTATNSIDAKGNTGITITGPSGSGVVIGS